MHKTIFTDIDGTLIKQDMGVHERLQKGISPEILPKVLYRMNEWDKAGFRVILTTGRKECWRDLTKKELLLLGITYDQLIMDCGIGERWLINDLKPDIDTPTANAICLPRNKGIGDVILET